MGQSIPVWVRNEWNASQKNVVDAARAAGTDSPILFVFVPKASAQELREQIIRAEAARGTIDGKGVPSTREGDEARSSMGTRLSDAERGRDQLIAQIASGAKVYKGGGTELFPLALAEKIREGATDALARLFPRFNLRRGEERGRGQGQGFYAGAGEPDGESGAAGGTAQG
jgi:hypothetical protein